MRNLVPYVVSRLDTASVSPLPLRKIAIDQETVFTCFLEDDTCVVHQWSPASGWGESVDFPLSEPDIRVVGLHGDSIDGKAVAVLSSGDVVDVLMEDGVASVVGSLDAKVAQCAWSPDGEMLCLALESGKVLFMSSGFDVLSEHDITASDLGLADKHVTVGWGKRETQFQGRGAKRDPTLLQKIEARTLSPADRGGTEISWRGDGEFVVLNTVVESQRALIVFNREGDVVSVSEPVADLLGYIAWQPNGALIACVKDDPTGSGGLQFFERNGLKRYNFEIPDRSEVTGIAWSSDSTILSITYPDRVDLWTVKNWHWYRKQTVLGKGFLSNVSWHPEKPGTMIAPSDTYLEFCTWRFAVNSDHGLVAVIDTNEVKVTPLAHIGMPPPMAFANIILPTQPCAVAVMAPTSVAVSLADGTVAQYRLDLDNEALFLESEYKTSPIRQLTYTAGGELVGLSVSNQFVSFGDSVVQPHLIQPSLPVSVLSGSHYMSGAQLYNLETGALIANFGEPCVDFVVSGHESFALSRTQKLIHGPTRTTLDFGVTSIMASDDHLLYTKLAQLKFIHFRGQDDGTAPAVPDDGKSEQTREIERGSLLVTIIPEEMITILQAPRGNIETIYPRMLVLGVVRRDILSGNYIGAFETCKVHRIDMNILHDLNPSLFNARLTEVVSQLKTPDNLDLFLSSLSDEDVTLTKYVDTKKTETVNTTAMISGKANSVLDSLIPHLPPQGQITALAMKQPPALAEALRAASKNVELVKHLVFLSEADTLYRTALGEYDPRLALVVAQQAQMDPKEYLHYLRARDAEAPARRKFNIDLYLRRYDKALESLVSMESGATDAEVAEFVVHHGLHDFALKLLRNTSLYPEAYREIMVSQAEIWLAASNHVRAGLNFELLGENVRAIEAYVLGGEWRKALSLAPSDERESVAQRLVDVLEPNKHFAGAAHLYYHYLGLPRRAVECYCLASLFDDAILTTKQANVDEESLHAYLRESFGVFQELLADCAAQIPSQLKRLREIRAKRDEDALGFDQLAGQINDLDVGDNLSVAGTETTNASIFTRYTDKGSVGTAATNATRRTIKNQRRQERKKARGKKGSVYEEDYLISSTARLVDRVASTRSELQALVEALERTRQHIYAVKLVEEYSKVRALLVDNLDEIYSIDERALVRYDQSGHEYTAEKPQKPAIPALIEL